MPLQGSRNLRTLFLLYSDTQRKQPANKTLQPRNKMFQTTVLNKAF